MATGNLEKITRHTRSLNTGKTVRGIDSSGPRASAPRRPSLHGVGLPRMPGVFCAYVAPVMFRSSVSPTGHRQPLPKAVAAKVFRVSGDTPAAISEPDGGLARRSALCQEKRNVHALPSSGLVATRYHWGVSRGNSHHPMGQLHPGAPSANTPVRFGCCGAGGVPAPNPCLYREPQGTVRQ